MSVASINVGFQVNVKELADKLNQAAAKLEEHKAKFEEVGNAIGKAGMYIGRYVDQMAGTVVSTIGGVVAFIPEIISALSKLNALIMANPWTALAAAITAAGTAVYFLTRKGNEAVQMQKMLNDVNTEALKNTAKERSELDSLLLVAQDENALKKDRLNAIKQLNEKSKEYLDNITLETINTKEATDAINKYIGALNSKAREQALMAKKTELYQKKIELETSKLGETGFLQDASDKIASMFGIQSDVIFTTKQEILDYAKSLNYTKEQTNSLLAVYEPYLKQREKEIGVYNRQIEALDNYAKAEGLANGAVNKSIQVHENSDKAISEKIKSLKAEREVLDRTSDKYKELTADIERYETMLGKGTKSKVIATPKPEKREKVTVAAVDGFTPVIAGSTAEMEKQIVVLKRLASERAKVFGEADNQVKAWRNEIQDIEVQIKLDTDGAGIKLGQFKESLSNMEASIEGQAEGHAQMMKQKQDDAEMYANIVGDSFLQMGDYIASSMGQGQSALEQFGIVMAQSVIKIMAMGLSQAMTNSVIIGTETAKSYGPLSAYVLPALLAASMGAVMSAFGSVPKFADGGIVYGPTLGLMGEYAGATSNPEVIAPLNKLRDLINPVSSGAPQVFLSGNWKVSGSDLQLILDRNSVKNNRIK